MPAPTQQHPEIVTYPTVVYQKTTVPPGYNAVPVASEAEVLALSGPVFLTAENAVRYQPPPEQPFPDFKRTDNFDQFDARKSVMGVEIPVPVTREATAQNTYVRTGPPDPIETQAAPAPPAPAPIGGSAPADPPQTGEPAS